MTKLNSEARRTLAAAGITVRDWIAYGGWLKETTDEAGDRRWVPETEWRGDECGCSDDRCIGYHHDEGEDCWCLPVLIENREKDREAYDIWQAYRAAVEANDGRGDQDAYDAAWSRAETWVRRHYPRALTFSLDAVVKASGASQPPTRRSRTGRSRTTSAPPQRATATASICGLRAPIPTATSAMNAPAPCTARARRTAVPTENYVAGLALRWARSDPLEQWVNAAPQGGTTPLEETISEYLGGHNPFPDELRVDVQDRDDVGTWVPGTIVERTAVDEWTVEYDDGAQVWRDHHELRPHSPEAG